MRSVYGILALSLSIMGGLTGFASQVEAQSAVPTLVITNDPLARAPSASPQPRAEIEAAKPQRSVDRGVTDLEELPPVVVDVPESETETLTGDILEDFNKEVQTATARRIKQLSDEYQSLQSVWRHCKRKCVICNPLIRAARKITMRISRPFRQSCKQEQHRVIPDWFAV